MLRDHVSQHAMPAVTMLACRWLLAGAAILALVLVPRFQVGPLACGFCYPTDGPDGLLGPNTNWTLVLAVGSPLVQGATARLTIFDLAGRRIARVSGPSGTMLHWDGRDDRTRGPTVAGIYFYLMEAGEHRQEGKFVVVR